MKNIAPVLGFTLFLAACGQARQQPQAGPPQVAYVTVAEKPVTLSSELPGRTSAYETSDVRPQVNGLVLARLFQEGDMVRQGQPLYRIDSSPYEAQVASARAALTRARAAIASSNALARRYGELVKINAISRQDFENATTSAQQAQADVAAQAAALRTAQIDLGRTTVKAPITGRIGRSTFTTGALVTAAQTEPLSVIQRLDPIYVDIQQSSADLLKLRQQILAGQVSRDRADARVRLKLEDGSDYGLVGSVEFAEVVVDQSTGTVTLRARFPNPKGLLLPGMFARAQFSQSIDQNAFLVPQEAVSRDPKGNATVWMVGANNKAVQREVKAERTQGAYWVVTSGLKNGDRVITQGTGTLKPNAAIRPVPANTPQRVAPPPRKDGDPAAGGDTTGRGSGGQSKAS